MASDAERGEWIGTIEALFPPDSEYEDTNEVGRRLLEEARRIARVDWRAESNEVLREYARLCMDEENRMANRATRRERW